MTLAEQWKQEGRLGVARSMLKKVLDTQVIVEVTGLGLIKEQIS